MGTVSATPSATTGTPRPAALTSAAEQEDRFMKLLVAQMKNQDPLNPMDNAQMTSQIAQINTVGGLEKLNRTVESLLAAFSGMQAQSALQLPGRSVLVEGRTLALAGGSATGGVQLAGDAQQVQVEILDAAGQVLRTLPLGASPAGVRSFGWDGRGDDGQAVADGPWRMRATATSADGKPVTVQTLSAQRVRSVSQAADGMQLDLGAAGLQPASAIRSFL